MLAQNSTNGITGQRLHDRYKIVRVLGAGGMGQTYIAEDTQRPGNPSCVVKQLKPASNDPNFLPNARRLFHIEAEILERLGSHDQIPRLLAYFEQNQEFYLVQEFIDGHPLSSELPLGHRWLEPQVIQLLKQILSILEFVHSHNAIHRDIKPDNLIRRQQDGKLALIDFGAVKQVRMQPTTALGQASLTIGIGTPGYMPTEQSKGTPRHSSDLYALGMVAIQALTGLLPTQLREDDEGEVIWRSHAEVSDQLAACLTKMVRYHFKDRYKTAAEALHTIQQLSSTTEPPPAAIIQPLYPPTVEANPAEELSTVQFGSAFPPTLEKAAIAPSTTTNPQNSESTVTAKRFHPRAGVTAMALAACVAGGGFLTYNQVQQHQQQALLSQIEQWQAEGSYGDCIAQAQTFPSHSNLSARAKTVLGECQIAQARQLLVQAQALMESDRLVDAIAAIRQISPSTPSYQEAQSLIHDWSDEILSRAASQYETGEFDTAIAMAKAVPADHAAAHEEAQKSIGQWSQEWQTNQTHLQTAQEQLNRGEWQAAIDAANQVTTEHWKQQAQPILTKANDELHLSAARAAIAAGRWRTAIEEANQVTADYHKQEAQDIITRANSAIARARDEEHLNAARSALEARRWQQAIDHARRANQTSYGREQARAIIAQAEATIRPIQEDGTLDATASQLGNGSYYREHTFEGNQGQTVAIRLESPAFDTFLILVGPDGQRVAEDDDSGDGTNSLVEIALPQTGTYWVRASALYPGDGGRYTLTIDRDR